MSAAIYLTTLALPLATILVVFGMRYFALIQQAKARLAGEEAYRQLVEKVAADQTTALTAIETRLTAIEKILKDVG